MFKECDSDKRNYHIRSYQEHILDHMGMVELVGLLEDFLRTWGSTKLHCLLLRFDVVVGQLVVQEEVTH